MTDQDTSAIRQLVHDYCDAIAHGSEAEFLALWCGEPSDAVISIVTEYRGPEGVAAFLAKLRGLYTSITLVEDDEPSIRPLTENAAIVVFRYHTETVYAETGEPGGIEGIETQVVRRTAYGWKLAHLHYSKKV